MNENVLSCTFGTGQGSEEGEASNETFTFHAAHGHGVVLLDSLHAQYECAAGLGDQTPVVVVRAQARRRQWPA